MEGCAVEVIRQIPKLSNYRVRSILQRETRQYKVTKSLLNLLYNIVIVGSVPTSVVQKVYFDQHSKLVWQLLSSSNTLRWKNEQFKKNIQFTKKVASTCPTVGGS